MSELEELQKKRTQFIHKLYEAIGGNRLSSESMYEIGEELSFDRVLTERIVQYLVDEGYIEYWEFGGRIRITREGIRRIEETMSEPSKKAGGVEEIAQGLKDKRSRFLRELYQRTGGDEFKGLKLEQISEELGLDTSSTWGIALHLKKQGLVRVTAGGYTTLTCDGISTVEEASSGKPIGEKMEARVSASLQEGISRFQREHDPSRTAFVMMKFSGDDPAKNDKLRSLFDTIKLELDRYGLGASRADDKDYSGETDLWDNVEIYMNGCDYGIAVLENLYSDEMNPNVALEYGYMLAKGKRVLLIKEKSFRNIRADILGKLWKEFEFGHSESIEKAIRSWMVDLDIRQLKA